MRISEKTRNRLYGAIHNSITDVRIKLLFRLSGQDDFVLAQVEHAIWAKQKEVLKLPDHL